MLSPFILACSVLLAGPIQKNSDVVEFEIQNERVDQSYLVIETPLFTGQFHVTIEPSDELGTVNVLLKGTIDRSFGAEHPLEADLRFAYPINQNTVDRVGNGRLVHGDGGVELFKAEKLAPVSFEWLNAKHPELGYIQVWGVENPDAQLSDSLIISLYHDMIGLDDEVGILGSDCDPSFTDCLNAAKTTCGAKKIGTFAYSCSEGTVSCSFTCLQSLPS